MRTVSVTVVAPATAAVLIGQQVGSNAVRDGLLLSSYPVSALPLFVAGAAFVALPATHASGRLLLRFTPRRVVPALLAASAVLFVIEWLLLAWPGAAAVVLYLHSSVLGALAVSAFWSLLNERFDPHAARTAMAKVSAAATAGGLAGGIGAARLTALASPGAVLIALAAVGIVSALGARLIGGPVIAASPTFDTEPAAAAWSEVRRHPLLANLAAVTVLGAALGSIVDYVMKAQAVAWVGQGPDLVRFFGAFYAATGVAGFVIQATAGRGALSRLGLAGSVACHPVAVGLAGVLGVVSPAAWVGLLPRALDQSVRNSVARAGYELLFTPVPAGAKRAAKASIDVTGDAIGKGIGAGLILLLTALVPHHVVSFANLAGVVVAAAGAAAALGLGPRYLAALGGALRRHGSEFDRATEQSLSDFTMVRSLPGIDAITLRGALSRPASAETEPADRVVVAFADLRSGDERRIGAALDDLPHDPMLVAALVPLLADKRRLRRVSDALSSFGARAAGELVSSLLDTTTPALVRRRIPLVLRACDSVVARDGLVAALDDEAFEVRSRSARALLALTERFPHLAVADAVALVAAERELSRGVAGAEARDHVLNLLALGLDREPVLIAANAFRHGDAAVRGTSIEYLETALPKPLFAALRPCLSADPLPVASRPASVVREALVAAGATMRIPRDELRRQLALDEAHPLHAETGDDR